MYLLKLMSRVAIKISRRLNNLDRNFTLNELDKELLKYSIFAPKHYSYFQRIDRIISSALPGITIVAGNRGVGKSSIINLCINNYLKNNKYIFIKIKMTNNDDSFYRDIFTYLREMNLEYYNIRTEIEKDIKKLEDKIYYNIIQEEASDLENLLLKEKKEDLVFEIKPSLRILGFKKSASKSDSWKNHERSVKKIIKTKRYYRDEIQKDIVNILNKISKHLKIIFIIDEVDKMSTDSFNDLLSSNKSIFLESNVSFFIIVDKEKCIDLMYNKSVFDTLVREYVYIPLLEWSEFLIICSRLNTNIPMEYIRSIYLETRGNFRKLISFQLSNKPNSVHKDAFCFWIYEHFFNLDYIKRLPLILKDYVKEFLFDFIELYTLVGQIRESELNELSNKYSENLYVVAIIKKLIEDIRNTSIKDISQMVRQTTLIEEIVRYHPPKKLYYNSFDNLNYHFFEYKTTELKDWIYYIGAWFDSIDFVCLSRQTINSRDINPVSYHCNIFVSNNYTEPTVLVNSGGIAWTHEYGNRKNELVEFLDSQGILYVEIDLQENVLNNEFLKNSIGLEEIKEKIKQKYDSIL